MLISEFINRLERVVPLGALGYERDAVGVQIGFSDDRALTRVLFVYEVTAQVVKEAREKQCNLIVAFHPLIFPSLSTVTDRTRTGRLVRELVQSDIALYVLHTAFDSQEEFGTSRLMAEVLQLERIEALAPLEKKLEKITAYVPQPKASAIAAAMALAGAGRTGQGEGRSFQLEGKALIRCPEVEHGADIVLEASSEVRLEVISEQWNTRRAIEAMISASDGKAVSWDVTPLETASPNFGMGAIGVWPGSRSVAQALESVQRAFGTPVLRYSGSGKEKVERVAVLGGAGMDFYRNAVARRADMFITADVRYHDFYRAEHDRLLLVDAGHAETERFVARGMREAAKQALENYVETDLTQPMLKPVLDRLLVSDVEPNAVHYFYKK